MRPDLPPPTSPSPGSMRDHLANERTLLSWVRLSIAITALGFVVARFGIFIAQLFAVQGQHVTETGLSVPVGIALVVAGPVFAFLAFRRFLISEEEIDTGQLYHHYGLIYATIIGTVIMGLALAVYLIVIATSSLPRLPLP
jgi:putative membrane protein